MTPTHRARQLLLRAAVASALGVPLVLGATAAPALAHPFGPPPVARIAADGSTVDVRWSAATDDIVALGQRVGVLGPISAATPDGAPLTGAERIAASPDTAAYLLERIQVRQDGEDCSGRLVDASDLVGAGAHLTFRCPTPVETVDLEVTTLQDIHEAYRTALVTDGAATPDRALTSRDQPVQTLTFGVQGAGASTVVPTVVAVAAVALVGGGILGWRRRAARADHRPPDAPAATPAAPSTAPDRESTPVGRP